MFNPIALDFLNLTHSDNKELDRLINQQNLSLMNIFSNLQENLFITEHNADTNLELVDHLVYKSPDSNSISSSPLELDVPNYPIGFVRSVNNRKAIVSRVLHFSSIIRDGQHYGIDGSGAITPSTQPRKDALIIGIAEGIGLIIQQNLPTTEHIA